MAPTCSPCQGQTPSLPAPPAGGTHGAQDVRRCGRGWGHAVVTHGGTSSSSPPGRGSGDTLPAVSTWGLTLGLTRGRAAQGLQ